MAFFNASCISFVCCSLFRGNANILESNILLHGYVMAVPHCPPLGDATLLLLRWCSECFLLRLKPCHMYHCPLKSLSHQRQGDHLPDTDVALAAKMCIMSTFPFIFKTWEFGKEWDSSLIDVSPWKWEEKTAGSPSWSGWIFFFMLCIQMRKGRITGDCQTLAWKMTPFSETVVLDNLFFLFKLCVWVGERSNRTAEKFIHIWVFHYRG